MRNLLLFAAALAVILPHSSAQDNDDAKARRIVSQMTLDEKISQMHGTQAKKLFRIVVGVPRLNIPDLLVTNGPAGFGPAGPGHQAAAVALPAPIALAATWDTDAAREYGAAGAGEAADLGNTFFEAPDINIARVPQNGRTFEAYGEDPFLVGRLAVANIEGIQSRHIIGNVKHYAANSQETQRRTMNAEIDERTLREIYLPAFEASVKEGHVGSAMGAYNKLNGVYCCENAPLLNHILKDEWGFDGFVSSDFGAVNSTVDSVMNGLDLEMPGGKYLGAPLKAAVASGAVPVAVIDEHLVRRFRTMMKLGVWDSQPPRQPIPQEADEAISRRIAEEGSVLLRNEAGFLPLKAANLKTVALIGPGAAAAATGGGGSSHVYPVTLLPPLPGFQRAVGSGVTVTLYPKDDPAAAALAAKGADVAVVMVLSQQAEGKDYPISLPGKQDAMVEAVAAANPHTVVVVKSGAPVLMPWAAQVQAILDVWYPGGEDGAVVPDLLFGNANPCGKLPITFPRRIEDLPASTPAQYPGTPDPKYLTAHYSEGVLVGYRWFDAKQIEPLYPFGFGLSYTTFAYRNLRLSAESLSANAANLTVEFDVANTGSRAGAEVGQVYVGLPSLPGVPQPPHQLKGFARLTVAPGASGHASISLNARAFSYWDTGSHGWKIAPGEYAISVGGSSRDLPLQAHVTIR